MLRGLLACWRVGELKLEGWRVEAGGLECLRVGVLEFLEWKWQLDWGYFKERGYAARPPQGSARATRKGRGGTTAAGSECRHWGLHAVASTRVLRLLDLTMRLSESQAPCDSRSSAGARLARA